MQGLAKEKAGAIGNAVQGLPVGGAADVAAKSTEKLKGAMGKIGFRGKKEDKPANVAEAAPVNPGGAESPVTNEDFIICKSCGNKIKAGKKFCAKCGTKVE